MINLRPYQQKMVDQIQQGMKRHKWQLLQLATGGGKTFTAGYMINKARLKGTSCTFLVPRRELLKQTAESFASVGIPFGYIAAGHTPNPRHLVQLATVGSLANRLDKLTPPKLIFPDETHFGSGQLDSIINWAKDAGSWGVGLSGTPWRSDGKGLGMWYDNMVEGPSVSELMDMGNLNRYRAFAPYSPDMSNIRKVAGKWNKGDLEEKIEGDKVLVGSSVKHYKERANGLLAVGFCVSVKHAKIASQAFNDAGIPASYIHGGMSDPERKAVIMAFARREIKVLFSCTMLSFGFDLASAAQMEVTVECLIDLQPMESLALQLQKWGRALRPWKHLSIFLDHAGNLERHGFPDDDQNWTLSDREKGSGGNSEPTLPTKQCNSCFFVHRPAPICPNCGEVHPVADRSIEEIEGELEEVKRQEKKEERQKQGRAQTLQDLLAIEKEKGYKSGWARNVFRARSRK